VRTGLNGPQVRPLNMTIDDDMPDRGALGAGGDWRCWRSEGGKREFEWFENTRHVTRRRKL